MNLKEFISRLQDLELEASDFGHNSEFVAVMAENPNHYLLMDVTIADFDGAKVILKFS